MTKPSFRISTKIKLHNLSQATKYWPIFSFNWYLHTLGSHQSRILNRSQLVGDKGRQWSDSGQIKRKSKTQKISHTDPKEWLWRHQCVTRRICFCLSPDYWAPRKLRSLFPFALDRVKDPILPKNGNVMFHLDQGLHQSISYTKSFMQENF